VGSSYQSDKELAIAKNGNVCEKVSGNDLVGSDKYKYDIYNLNLKPLEIVEVIIDTDTQKYEVKRERKKGWYLTYVDVQVYWVARYWDGEKFSAVPKNPDSIRYPEDALIIDKTPLDSPFLKELE